MNISEKCQAIFQLLFYLEENVSLARFLFLFAMVEHPPESFVIFRHLLRSFLSTRLVNMDWMFTSCKFKQDLSLRENKSHRIVTQKWVVYFFKCELCDAGYVGYTKGHLHTRIEGHRQKVPSIYKHYFKEHNTAVPNNSLASFNVIKKCTNKFVWLVNEMLCIQDLKPALNVKSDSLRAKVFIYLAWNSFIQIRFNL